ncbi:DedA family protein [Georgenia sp. EYE_87]|uniref:DedA family protein n=1 Tax=Georgenia sp. EYE_87 TaxID=2853448 RepID=UPI00200649A0|nr:DedA family protein [Georgenia sp. EYE_87]MCK6209914.1 DedA family protein [Georgenia sp. EYE_87]
MELMQAVEEFVLGLAGSPWILLAVTVLATIDGFFPPVPSESIVIAVAALSVSGDAPSLWFLVLAAAVGAFSGDLIAYTIGTKVPIENLRVLRGPRGRAALARAKRALAHRGAVYILSARFIPIGRVAVNMTAGAVGYPRKRFIGIAAIAAVVWGGYSTLMGLGAGVFLHEHPLIAVAVGVAGGVAAGFAVDKLLGVIQRRWFPDLPPPAVRMHVEDDDTEEAAGDGVGREDAGVSRQSGDAVSREATGESVGRVAARDVGRQAAGDRTGREAGHDGSTNLTDGAVARPRQAERTGSEPGPV